MSERLRVVILGNYRQYGQQSMLRYETMLADGLAERGIHCDLVWPEPFFIRLPLLGYCKKWLAHLDNYGWFAIRLLFEQSRWREGAVVHIVDHSNAPWVFVVNRVPVVVTCHDAGAIRGALGTLEDCKASATGKWLQRWIAAGLRAAGGVACVSEATRKDLLETVFFNQPPRRLIVAPNAMNRPFGLLAPDSAKQKLEKHDPQLLQQPYLLHVGSALARKNRNGTVRIFQKISGTWKGQLVFAGEPLLEDTMALIREYGLEKRVIHVENPDDGLLEALYRNAFALLYPSRFEGFGWPVVEAQMCGCPVLTADNSALPEVAGEGALLRRVEDEEGFAQDILSLMIPQKRVALIEKGKKNAERFSTKVMMDAFLNLYGEVVRQ